MTGSPPAPAKELRLVPLSVDHASCVVHWRNDPASRPFFLGSGDLRYDSQIVWTQRQRQDPADHTFIALWGEMPVGMTAVYGIQAGEKIAEYGRLLIDPAWRRRGIGIAITGLVLAHGFGSLGLEMIYSNCLFDNRPIHNLLQTLGFHAAGRWHHAASRRDVTRLELAATAWNASAPNEVYGPAVASRLQAKPAAGHDDAAGAAAS
jgi:RimJ/RimL family protein N-acetyltransferase